MRVALITVLLLFSSVAGALPQDAFAPVVNPFTFRVPVGFTALPEKNRPQDCLYAFSDGKHPPLQLLISVDEAPMVQGTGLRLSPAMKRAHASVFRESWRGVSIYGRRTVSGDDRDPQIALNLYVPLRTCTVVLESQCFVERELDALIALRETLSSLKGDTHWRPDAPPPSHGIAAPGPVYLSGSGYSGFNNYRPERDYPSKPEAPEGLAIRSSIDQLFWASLVCSIPFALGWGLWMLRRRPQVAFVPTTRPLYKELKGWGGPVPRP